MAAGLMNSTSAEVTVGLITVIMNIGRPTCTKMFVFKKMIPFAIMHQSKFYFSILI